MRWFLAVVCVLPCVALAQSQQQTTAKVPEVRTTVVVVGTPDPIAQEDSPRATETVAVQAHPLAFTDTNDMLRDDASVDLEQRGGGGVQTDVTIRGGSFEQVLVLLNGLRINDVETSHFNLDLPVPMEMIDTVNVLHGAGSTLYGSDAVSGVVDFETAKPPDGWLLRLRAGGGTHGEDDDAALASWSGRIAGGKSLSEVVGGERDFSDGFIADRDYRSEDASSETRFQSPLGISDVLLAGSDRRFGANQFYGNYDSWERTKGWFSAINQQIDDKTQASLAYRRHSDIFVLLRDDPAVYKNQHVDTSWQAAVRRKDDLPWNGAAVYYGLEEDADQINSTNLGQHGRNRGAGYADFELRGESWGTISAGLREEVFGGGPVVTTPTVAGSAWLKRKVKLRASVESGFRQPTYTDLYYSDPTTLGNPNLKPESSWNYEGGADWYASERLTLTLTAFHSSLANAIDYVRPYPTTMTPSPLWQAANLNGVTFNGVESAMDWRPIAGQSFRLGLTTLQGSQSALNGLQSEYVFNYPIQNAVAEWVGRWKSGLLLRQRVRVVNRVDRGVSPIWDASAVYEGKRVEPYLQLTNLSNTDYQEIVGVQMPTRAIVAGVQVELRRKGN
jgi:iron complex outermembrane receptor protein